MASLNTILPDIQDDLDRLNEIIEQALKSGNELMNSIVSSYLKVKGKQLRPALVVLSSRMFSGVNQAVLYAGAAVELLHNASLIHDDVIDQSQVRRGVQTINSVWDNHLAVLTGDFFVSASLLCATKTKNLQIIESLAGLGTDLSLGEVDQIDEAQHHNINQQSYFGIIAAKTASLFTSCIEMGALAAGAKSEELGPLKEFAHLMGLCFQIKDDTFDYFSDPKVGKPTGNDLREGKITLPLIHALRTAPEAERAAVEPLLQQGNPNEEDIQTLIDFAKRHGGIDYAYSVMHEMREQSLPLLEDYRRRAPKQVEQLHELFTYIIEREK